MRGGERLVQVDVHGVDAEVARPRLARDGVEVRAVAIEIGAGLVQRGGDLHHIALEQPAGVGVGEHHGRDIRPELFAHGFDADGSVLAGGHGANREAEQSRRRRVGAVRRVRHEHDAPRIGLAARFERRADRNHAAKLAMRAGLGRQRHRLHAGQLKQPAAQLLHQRERALHRLLRLQRMDVREARQPRHLLVQARIVLHGARAEREDAGVDGVVLLAQADVVADRPPAPTGRAGRWGRCAQGRRGGSGLQTPSPRPSPLGERGRPNCLRRNSRVPLTPALSPRGEGAGCDPVSGAEANSASLLPLGRRTG